MRDKNGVEIKVGDTLRSTELRARGERLRRPLDPADIKPLSEKALAHPLMKLIKKRNFREWKP